MLLIETKSLFSRTVRMGTITRAAHWLQGQKRRVKSRSRTTYCHLSLRRVYHAHDLKGQEEMSYQVNLKRSKRGKRLKEESLAEARHLMTKVGVVKPKRHQSGLCDELDKKYPLSKRSRTSTWHLQETRDSLPLIVRHKSFQTPTTATQMQIGSSFLNEPLAKKLP